MIALVAISMSINAQTSVYRTVSVLSTDTELDISDGSEDFVPNGGISDLGVQPHPDDIAGNPFNDMSYTPAIQIMTFYFSSITSGVKTVRLYQSGKGGYLTKPSDFDNATPSHILYITVNVSNPVSAFTISNASGFSPLVACDFYSGGTKYHDGSGSTPVVGDTVYTDSAGTQTIDGQNKWYKLIGTDDVIKIDSSGEVVMVEECLGGPQH